MSEAKGGGMSEGLRERYPAWSRRAIDASRKIRTVALVLLTLLLAFVGALSFRVAWWTWLSIGLVASYTGALRMIWQRGWIADLSSYRGYRSDATKMWIAVWAALPLAVVWPVVLIATLESPDKRRARKRAEAALEQVREAKALAERERALGIGERR